MPRTVRISMKSGVLPQPRQVVPRILTSYERAEAAKHSTRFSDPAMAPRGSHPDPPSRLPKTAQQKIDGSAKPPSASKPAPVSAQGQWKQHIADVRRSYLESTLKAYEAQEARHKEIREKRKASSNVAESKNLTEVTDSLATMLTTPTIDQSLAGEFVVKRTPEEAEELRLKREHNRKLTEQQLLEKQHEDLLTLYQQAASFITTEEQLESRIAALFKPAKSLPSIGTNDTQTPSWWKYARSDLSATQAAHAKQRIREDELVDAVQGTIKLKDGAAVRYAPGLKATRQEKS